jgi:pimeloyl-ACP methyl ester carboxylesterase
VVVGHSLGGFTAPLVCVRIPVDLLVLVAAMIPSPGELFADWWANVGYEESGYEDVFYHDVPPQLAADARRRERNETSRELQEPWPLEAWPETTTRYLLCRDDRMFSAAWARRHARERLGVEPDEMDGGHSSASAVRLSWLTGSPLTEPAAASLVRARSRLTASARSGSGVRAGWTGKHCRDILEQLESAVERSAGNHVEGDIGITVIDPVAAGAPGDHGEDDHAKTVHQARLEERPA